LVTDVARGLVVNEQVIAARVDAELPFMATEEILMAATTGSKTANRQDLHERIRRHSMDAARQVKEHGRANDLLERLAKDPAFARVNLQKTLDPSRHVGLAPQQVDQFLRGVVQPILKRHASARNKAVSLSV
jgi:adenylosuccinate lyase